MSKVPKITFQERYLEIGETLKTHFTNLQLSQESFISYCKFNGRLLFIENQRFSLEEQGFSDKYKMQTALQKVLALEYQEDLSFVTKPGSTETFHAVIAVPRECEEIINRVNNTKKLICDLLSVTLDSRTKVDGEWQPMNKELMRAIGRPRANLKQIRRRLNVHTQQYKRISYSGTWQRPIYRKTLDEIVSLLNTYTSEQAKMDIETLQKFNHIKEFALFYPKHYSSMDGNFKLIEPITKINADNSEKKIGIRTQKISSPIYLLCDGSVDDVDLEIKYKMAENKNNRSDFKNTISEEPILKSLPVYTYQ